VVTIEIVGTIEGTVETIVETAVTTDEITGAPTDAVMTVETIDEIDAVMMTGEAMEVVVVVMDEAEVEEEGVGEGEK